jgi:hypothetical protein
MAGAYKFDIQLGDRDDGMNDQGSGLKPLKDRGRLPQLILKTKQRFDLPPVQLVTSSALFVEREGKIEVLNKGYHDSLGGTLVTKRHKITEIPLEDAVPALLALLDDFLFADPSDKSRALAGLCSPSLRLGELLRCDFLLDMAEAEESQSGKTY